MRQSIALLLGLLMLVSAVPARALDPGKQADFDAVMRMDMPTLTAKAGAILDREYPDEDWDRYRFPSYVFTSDPVEIGYKIAVKRPELLKGITCYCFCQVMGHDSLYNCFVKKGDPIRFDDHASGCNICYGEAMMALIWDDMGASAVDISQGMAKRFERLRKEHEGK